MLPPRPSPRRDALEKRVGAAFDMMKAPAAASGHADLEEQEEDELLQELQTALDRVDEVVAQLRAAQAKEKGEGEDGAKIEDDTGSPSMQGMAG
ncbi:MAG: hypothetical protein KGL39_25780 [Patescibacteria group bacterium]|nr:hypothetical protein [Patescibacteria group bacterium]